MTEINSLEVSDSTLDLVEAEPSSYGAYRKLDKAVVGDEVRRSLRLFRCVHASL